MARLRKKFAKPAATAESSRSARCYSGEGASSTRKVDSYQVIRLSEAGGFSSQEELAEAAGISPRSVWTAMRGGRLSVRKLQGLARALLHTESNWTLLVLPVETLRSSTESISNHLKRAGGNIEIGSLEDLIRELDEKITGQGDGNYIQMLEADKQNLLALFKSLILASEASGYAYSLPEGREVLCLDTSLEQKGYDYWESLLGFNELLKRAILMIDRFKANPALYQTIVTITSFSDFTHPQKSGPLLRFAGLLASSGAPVGYVEGRVLRRRDLYQDFSISGQFNTVCYSMPNWLGTTVTRNPKIAADRRDLWKSAAQMVEVCWVKTASDLPQLTERSRTPDGCEVGDQAPR